MSARVSDMETMRWNAFRAKMQAEIDTEICVLRLRTEALEAEYNWEALECAVATRRPPPLFDLKNAYGVYVSTRKAYRCAREAHKGLGVAHR